MDQHLDDREPDPFEEEPPALRPRPRHAGLAVAWLAFVVGLGGLIAWLAITAESAPPPRLRIALAPPPPVAAAPTAVAPRESEPAPGPVGDQTAPPVGATASPQGAGSREAAASATPGAAPVTPGAVPATPTAPAEEPAAAAAPPPAKSGSRGDEAALVPAPDPALVKQTPVGLLPIIGADGRKPWRVYARPFTADPATPRIAVLLGGLGLSRSATSAAVQRLPGSVTLAFAPYAQNLQAWIAEARAAGHEVMLQLPMEPFDYPKNDPGPYTLLTSLTENENIARLEWLLGRFTGYVGVTNLMGAKFTTSASHLRPIMKALKERGLMFLDARVTNQSVAARVARDTAVPRALNNRFIDAVASRAAIDAQLSELERIAQLTGSAVGIGYAYPVTIERLANWAPTLRLKGIALAPVSALANRQKVP